MYLQCDRLEGLYHILEFGRQENHPEVPRSSPCEASSQHCQSSASWDIRYQCSSAAAADEAARRA